MVIVVQLARIPDCGSGDGESYSLFHPKKNKQENLSLISH